ncbi:hypothetical protein GQ600_9075 [Phytophthora cactorum]|nr:hypothetical protein GQ600_9075 [Phytophthora cactorum]
MGGLIYVAGWISVKKLPAIPTSTGWPTLWLQCDSDKVDVPVARKHQFMAKSRQERSNLRFWNTQSYRIRTTKKCWIFSLLAVLSTKCPSRVHRSGGDSGLLQEFSLLDAIHSVTTPRHLLPQAWVEIVQEECSRKYSPVYDRCRREKKKAERQALVSQVAQYETSWSFCELRSRTYTDFQVGVVHVATEEESAARLRRSIDSAGIIALQLNAIKILMATWPGSTRVPSMMTQLSPSIGPITTGTFASSRAIAAHLKGMFGRLRLQQTACFPPLL